MMKTSLATIYCVAAMMVPFAANAETAAVASGEAYCERTIIRDADGGETITERCWTFSNGTQ